MICFEYLKYCWRSASLSKINGSITQKKVESCKPLKNSEIPMYPAKIEKYNNRLIF